jgi:heat shock protein HslJ
MNILKALFLLSAALILGGCASTPQSIGGNYALVSLTDASTSVDEPIIMHVTNNSISGSGPVNQWQGAIDGDEVGMIISTRRAGPPDMMQYESDLLAALEGAEFELESDGKLIFKKKRKVTAVFQYVDVTPASTTEK